MRPIATDKSNFEELRKAGQIYVSEMDAQDVAGLRKQLKAAEKFSDK